MERATRLSSSLDNHDGLRVTTQAGGSTYVYELRRTEADSDTLEVVSKTVDGETVEPEATEAVEDVAADYGFDVQ